MRFTIVKPEATTEQPLAKFETTQIYLPEDFTTADVEFVDSVPRHPNENHAAVINPYSLDLGDDHLHVGDAAASLVGDDDLGDEDEDHHGDPEDKRLNANRKQGKRRRAGSGRRRRIENENGQTGRGRGSRYKRHAILHDTEASPETDRWAGSKLAAEGDVYYVHIADILKSREPNRELKSKLHKLKMKARLNKCLAEGGKEKCTRLLKKKPKKKVVEKEQTLKKEKKFPKEEQSKEKVPENGQTPKEDELELDHPETAAAHHRRRGDSHAAELDQRDRSPRWRRRRSTEFKGDLGQLPPESGIGPEPEPLADQNLKDLQQYGNQSSSARVALLWQRVKRKSGKTTGALSRPKGGGDSSSKTTSRKDKGECAPARRPDTGNATVPNAFEALICRRCRCLVVCLSVRVALSDLAEISRRAESSARKSLAKVEGRQVAVEVQEWSVTSTRLLTVGSQNKNHL